jgi:hypothetical protein
MEQGTKMNVDWKDMEQEVTLQLAVSQKKLDQMIQQIQEWATPRNHPNEWLAAQKKKKEAEAFYQLEKERLQFFISFWETLKQMKEKSSFIQLLPNLFSKDWECDGILLTTGGVYVFHLLPYQLTGFSLEHPLLHVAGAKPVPVFHKDKVSSIIHEDEPYSISFEKGLEKMWVLGQDREKVHYLQRKLSIPSLPVYELYVAPFGARNIRFLFDETVIASFEQISGLLQNLNIQPDTEQFENQQKLFYELSSYARPYEINLLSAQKTTRSVNKSMSGLEAQPMTETRPIEPKADKPLAVPHLMETFTNDVVQTAEAVSQPRDETVPQPIVEPSSPPSKAEPEWNMDKEESFSQKINHLFDENEQITLVPKSRKKSKDQFLDRLLDKLFGKKTASRHNHRKK